MSRTKTAGSWTAIICCTAGGVIVGFKFGWEVGAASYLMVLSIVGAIEKAANAILWSLSETL